MAGRAPDPGGGGQACFLAEWRWKKNKKPGKEVSAMGVGKECGVKEAERKF